MNPQIYKSIHESIRINPSFDTRWNGDDKGMVTSWEVGRELSIKEPDLAEKAKNGELPVLGWKGGIEKKIQNKSKYGSLNYLATWQGLRGENLNIDLSEEIVLTCSKTGMKITYTSDSTKFANA